MTNLDMGRSRMTTAHSSSGILQHLNLFVSWTISTFWP